MGASTSTLNSFIEARARELDVLSRAVIATDIDGHVVYWNDAAQSLYGWSSDEAMGRSITDLTPIEQSRGEAVRIIEQLRHGLHWSGEFPVKTKDGASFVAHVIDAPVHDESGALVGIIGLSSDVSPVVRLQRLARDLSAALTPAEVADTTLRACMECAGAAAGSFMILAPDKLTLHSLAAIGYSPEEVERFRSIAIDSPLPIAAAAKNGEAIFASSPQEFTRRFPAVADYLDPRTRGWVAMPLTIGQRVLGVVGLSVRFQRDFPDEDRDLLVAITQHATVAVERATLFKAERDARKEAEHARAVAEEANGAKSAFLATMSHELRTPLGAILGYQDLLATEVAGPVNDKQREFLKRMRSSATHLLSLIDEVLTFARLEAARETVDVATHPLGPVLEQVSDIVRPLAQAKGLTYECIVHDATAPLRTDIQKLRQILVNLGGNAVKYTERGSITITCFVSGQELIAKISDTGIGIAPEHLSMAFDPFWQAESARNRRSGGTGLGLAVSRNLARLLGGEITVESVPGRGSTFILRIPV